MFRKTIRVLAVLGLLGSVVIGAFATYVWLTPSDEQILYDQKYREAQEKFKQLQAAKGTAAEARLAKEFKDAADSAEVWGRGYRERSSTNRLGVVACAVGAFVSFVIFLLTFAGRKKNVAVPPTAWAGQNYPTNYPPQPGIQERQPPGN